MMTPEFSKILYATDLSQSAAHAFRYAMTLAKRFDAHVTILHVVEEMSEDAKLAFEAYFEPEIRKGISPRREAGALERMRERVAKFCEEQMTGEFEACTSMVSIKVCKGYPEEQILKKSDEYESDIIVMGTHEKGFTHTFLGSVAKRVLRRSRKPVFIIPLPKK